jgi:hypothetical protein
MTTIATNGSPATTDRPKSERKEPTYLFTEKHVADKSEIARRFIETRARLNATVDKADNFLVKRFYNVDDCIFYHAIQAYRLGVSRAEQEEAINVAMVVGGSIVIPHLRRAYELLEEIYA